MRVHWTDNCYNCIFYTGNVDRGWCSYKDEDTIPDEYCDSYVFCSEE